MELFSRLRAYGRRRFRDFQKVVKAEHERVRATIICPGTGNLRSIAAATNEAQTVSQALLISRRMKIMSNRAGNSSVTNAAIAGGNSASPAKKRAVRRCQLVASAQVMERDSQTQLSARVSEIGLGGCYIDTLAPFPDGTLVHIRIIRDGGAFECEAKVVYVHQSFGMGVAFTNIAVDQRRLLENWIADLVTKSK
jgi:PilZ domain-containing protein